MIIALTGTPGTGKSEACSLIRQYNIIDLNELIKKNSALFGYDKERDSIDVSTDKMRKLIPHQDNTTIIEGHLSHYLDAEITIVLRCSPGTLGERLRKRGWPEKKVRENQEAEAVDVILIEALRKRKKVFEIDTSDMKPNEVAKAIREIIEGKGTKYRPGKVDWSKEVMDWY